MKHALRLLIALMFLLGVSSMASAYQGTFFGQDLGNGESTVLSSWVNAKAAETSFKSNLVGVGTETFEGQTTGAGTPLAITFGAAGTATINGDGSIVNTALNTTNGYGRYGISGGFGAAGGKFWESGETFNIAFSAPIAAFGFYGIDIGDFNGQVTATLSNGQIVVYNIGNSTNISGGSVLFWGVIDTEHLFTSVSFGNTAAGTDFFGFDDMTIGSVQQVVPSPEPMTMLLLGLGFLGLAGLRKRD